MIGMAVPLSPSTVFRLEIRNFMKFYMQMTFLITRKISRCSRHIVMHSQEKKGAS